MGAILTLTTEHPRAVLFFFALLLIGLAVCYWKRNRILTLLKRYHRLWRIAVFLRRHKQPVYWGLALAAIFLVFSLGLLWTSQDRTTSSSVLGFIVQSPGTFFVFAMACLTAIGFFITMSRVDELASMITTYDELLIRAARLLENELRASSVENEPRVVRTICMTPLHGNVTERDAGCYRRYHALLERAEESLVLHILHASRNELDHFYDAFTAQPQYDPVMVSIARHETDQIIARLHEITQIRERERRVGVPRSLPPHEARALRAPVGYRLLLTRNKAIFYVPLFLPPEKSAAYAGNGIPSLRGPQVQMVGFETEDMSLIGQFNRDFDYLMDESLVAEALHLQDVRIHVGHVLRLSSMRP